MINLSVKGKYGLSAVFGIALQENQKPIQIRTLAEERNIPQNYLEQILVELKRVGIVKSFRGAHGGYALAKSPSQITIKDVLLCLEGPSQISSSYCGCAVLTQFWENVETKLENEFNVTFETLIKEKQKQDKMPSYSI